jgi:hypothetical protein
MTRLFSLCPGRKGTAAIPENVGASLQNHLLLSDLIVSWISH